MFRNGKIAILGGGLLGGSLALALQNGEVARVWCRREASVQDGKELGLDASSSLPYVVEDADLVILCVPVGAMKPLLQDAIDAGLPRKALITDVGSVKRMPHEALRAIIETNDLSFIGSHPMAGGEKGGIQHAKANLFQNAACILTNDFFVNSDIATELEAFWKNLGCRTAWMSADMHDTLVARVSHFPHLLAALGIKVALPDLAFAQHAGGGLRDTTRVAGGNPNMWLEILSENRDAILPALDEAMLELSKLRDFLQNQRQNELLDWLSEAKQLRDGFQ